MKKTVYTAIATVALCAWSMAWASPQTSGGTELLVAVRVFITERPNHKRAQYSERLAQLRSTDVEHQRRFQHCIGVSMKAHSEYLTFNTKNHREYIHITPQVEAALGRSGVREGMVLVSAMHITAGVYVNDDESGLIDDIDESLEGLAPFCEDYRHHQTEEDNGDSHLKAILVHHQVLLPVTAGTLDLGTWQRVFYAQFDGQRPKHVSVKVIGE